MFDKFLQLFTRPISPNILTLYIEFAIITLVMRLHVTMCLATLRASGYIGVFPPLRESGYIGVFTATSVNSVIRIKGADTCVCSF